MDHHKHYIRLDADKKIIRGFSDAFEQPKKGDICINEQGDRHFELDSEINPVLITNESIPLYEWKSGKVIKRSQMNIQADIDALLMLEAPIDQFAQITKEIKQTQADVDYIAIMIGVDLDV